MAYVKYNDLTITIPELSYITGIPARILYDRYDNGIRGNDLVFSKARHLMEYLGHYYTAEELAKEYSVNLATIKTRWYKGKRGEDLVKRSNVAKTRVYIELDGTEYSITQLAAKFNVSYSTIRNRYNKGIRGKALVEPLVPDAMIASNRRPAKVIDFKGKPTTITKLAKDYDLSYSTIYARYNNGLREEDLVTPVLNSKATLRLTYQGKEMSLVEFVSMTKYTEYKVRKFYRTGITGEELTTILIRDSEVSPTPTLTMESSELVRPIMVNINNRKLSLAEISLEYKVNFGILLKRYRRGMRDMELLDGIA